MSEREQEGNRIAEEADQLLRSTKKMKRAMERPYSDNVEREDVDMIEVELSSPNVSETAPLNLGTVGRERTISYRDTLQQNNPNLSFETTENPIWKDARCEYLSEDDEPPEQDDPTCPKILLTAAEKRM